MTKQLATWQFIYLNLLQQIPVILLYVLQSEGSSPGRRGFFMGVNKKGDMQGSIGGGIMEYKLVELAKERLRNKKNESSIKKQVHNKSAGKHQSGMICSGAQDVLLYELKLSDQEYIKNIIYSLKENTNGHLQLSPDGIVFSEEQLAGGFEYIATNEDNWIYKENIGYKNKLYIVGGGHCALAFSRLMHTMDFYIQLYEERKDLNTMMNNSFVHEKTLVRDYTELSTLIPSGSNHYIVIMTVGYRTDYIALKSLLEKDVKYLGVLGSKAKMEKLFEDYRNEGIDQKRLEQLYTPIGIPIHSQTPEEIAVSIAAEIIKIKNI